MAEYDFVIREKDMGINLEGKNGQPEYIEKASFAMELLQHIDAGHQSSGFVAKVTCSLREETRKCYFRIQKALTGGLGRFLEDLNTTFGSGVLMCNFDPQEFRCFLKWIMKNYFRKCRIAGSKDTFKAAVCVGRQPDSNVWVLGNDVQIDSSGAVVRKQDQEILWINAVFEMEEGYRKEPCSPLPKIYLPLSSLTLGDVVGSLKDIIHDNFMAGVFTIAGMLLGLHYEAIMDVLGFCPIPVICGVNRLGKTKSAITALSLIGNGHSFYSAVKERFIPRLCSRSSLPPVLDDIKKPKVIEDIAVSFYNKGKDGTCHLETSPRTCPILTVNWEVLDGLGKDPRILGRLVLIPFLEGRRSPMGTDAQQQAEAKHMSVLENASKAVGCLIGINEQVNHLCYGRMKELVSYLAKVTPGLDDRCMKNYALLISFAEKVIDLAEIEQVDASLARDFFVKVMHKHAVEEYQEETITSHMQPESGEPLIVDLLMRCIQVFKIPRQNMLTCINPEVSFKSKNSRLTTGAVTKHCGVAVALKCLYALVRSYGGTPPSEERVRGEIRNLDIGDTTDKKQFFNKNPNGFKITRAAGKGVEVVQISCVTVKQSAFGAESWKIFCEAFGIKVHQSLPVTQEATKENCATPTVTDCVTAPGTDCATPAVTDCATAAVTVCTTPAVIECSTPVVTYCAQPAVRDCSTSAVRDCASSAFRDCSTPAVRDFSTSTVPDCATPAVTDCSSPAVPDYATPAVRDGAISAVRDGATSAVSECATPAVTDCATPAVPDCATLAVTDLDCATPAVRDSATSAVTESSTPDVTDCAAPAVKDGATSAVRDSATSAVTECSTPAVRDYAMPAVRDCATPAVPDCATPAVPDCATPAVPDCATPAVPDCATPAVPDYTTLAVTDCATQAVPDCATLAVTNCADLNDSGICLQASEYDYCLCKQKRSRKEESGMIICENRKRMVGKKCPGNRYFHLKCLKLKKVPHDDPWYCPTCRETCNRRE